MRGVNPEVGIFGIVKDVNREGDPYLMQCLRGDRPAEVIWSNVLVDDSLVPHWTGHGEEMPTRGRNWLGEWTPDRKGADGNPVPPSHPNARVTLSCSSIENYNGALGENSRGVLIKVITYSGRDSNTMPPVWVAKNADHGVAIGASIVSAATATEVGATGVNRQPWANAPFVPGPLADYMGAQFKFFNSSRLLQKPIMAGLNYFLTRGARGGDPQDTRLLGEKRDVKVWLTWLERRAHHDVKAISTPIGYLPLFADLQTLFWDTINKEYSRDLYDKQFSLYLENIIARIDFQKDAYGKEKDCPPRIFEIYEEQRQGLEELRREFSNVVTPDQLIEAGGIA